MNSPSAQDCETGVQVAEELEKLNVKGILIAAARAGYITELRCEMPYCFASDRGGFVPDSKPHGPWMPTHEHFPLAKRYQGKRDVTNAVLAHRRCNNVGFKIDELMGILKAFRLEDGSSLRAEAIAAAIADHVEQRGLAEGCYPKNSGAHRRALRKAREAHALLVSPKPPSGLAE